MQAATTIGTEDLDLSMFTEGDLVNIVLQRSEIARDTPNPGAMIRAWSGGDHGPLRDYVRARGRALVERAIDVAAREFASIEDHIAPLAPGRVADIGCGYGFADLLLHRSLGCDVVLIDIEASDDRHFGFQEQGAGYTSLETARRFLVANGVPDTAITTWNPTGTEEVDTGQVDLAFSLLSCGFHYPLDMYLPFFRYAVRPGGGVLVDLRAAYAEEGRAALAELGRVREIGQRGKARRVLAIREDAA